MPSRSGTPNPAPSLQAVRAQNMVNAEISRKMMFLIIEVSE